MSESNIQHRKRVVRRTHNFNEITSNDPQSNSFSMSNHDFQQRSTYVRNRLDGLSCTICGGLAHGYNFNAITCESCKAFFRRNALQTDKKFKCRIGDGRCPITITTRKSCKACRLAKCFEKGMRADWILTDEERINKRQKIEDNRRLRQSIYPDSFENDKMSCMEMKTEPYEDEERSTCSITSEDLIKIQQIEKAYDESVRLTSLSSEFPSYPHTIRITETSDMLNVLTNMLSTRLITFLKFLPEFSSLNEHDKLILIKHNTLALSVIRAVLNYNPLTDTYREPNTDECVFTGDDLIQCFTLEQYERSRKCIKNLFYDSLDDRFVLKVLLIIMALSKGSSISTCTKEKEPIARDIISIYQAQNVYIDILWKYCESKFGFTTTAKTMLKLTMYSMNAHLEAYNTRRNYAKFDSVAEQLSPLIKSVFFMV